MHYLYLHGFASSPQSSKAQAIRDRLAQQGIPLPIPDLNQDDFAHLTLSRQIQQTAALLPPVPTPVTLIGSSFGGLTAAWVAEQHPQVARLVLLAPAFGFPGRWVQRLGPAARQQWETTGWLAVYHYAARRALPLHYGFMTDAAQYDETALQRAVPTLILHGRQDDVVPLQASQDYARSRPWVTLQALDSDHALTDAIAPIWQAIQDFCQLT